MSLVTCPACGHSGEIKGTEEHFESRGQWPDGHWFARKCRGCDGGVIIKAGLRGWRVKVIEPSVWQWMEEAYSAALAREHVGLSGDSGDARYDAMTSAGNRIGQELSAAPVDNFFISLFLSCLWGASYTLGTFGSTIEDPEERVDNVPALAFVASLSDPEAFERALRVVTWALATRVITRTWPDIRDELLDTARIAMPVPDHEYAAIQELAQVTADERKPLPADDPRNEEDVQNGRRYTFDCESLVLTVKAGTGTRYSHDELFLVTLAWSIALGEGMNALMARLDEIDPLPNANTNAAS